MLIGRWTIVGGWVKRRADKRGKVSKLWYKIIFTSLERVDKKTGWVDKKCVWMASLEIRICVCIYITAWKDKDVKQTNYLQNWTVGTGRIVNNTTKQIIPIASDALLIHVNKWIKTMVNCVAGAYVAESRIKKYFAFASHCFKVSEQF